MSEERKFGFSFWNEQEECEDEYVFPAKWEICSTCSGEGKHSRHIGAITEEDRERDWSDDEFEAYIRGDLDMTCDDCAGNGKVLVPVLEGAPKHIVKLYRQAEKEREDDARTQRYEDGDYGQY